jgi:hypothetical protein
MDPYLEAPDIWPDFHDALAGEIRRALNRTLPSPYYARLVMRPEVGIIGEESKRSLVPDVTVQRSTGRETPQTGAAMAVLDSPRTTVSQSVSVLVEVEPLRHQYVEIRDASRGHSLVTLIEIISPSNKRPGVDRRAYLDKQREVLDSDASLIELDLLRKGDRLIAFPAAIDAVSRLEPKPDYLVSLSRAWERGAKLHCELFPTTVRDSLPCIPVPLREGEDEIVLDLQYVFQQAYDSGPYARGAVDYTRPPEPPLDAEAAAWAQTLLQSAR